MGPPAWGLQHGASSMGPPAWGLQHGASSMGPPVSGLQQSETTKTGLSLTLKLILIRYSIPSFSTNGFFLKLSRSPEEGEQHAVVYLTKGRMTSQLAFLNAPVVVTLPTRWQRAPRRWGSATRKSLTRQHGTLSPNEETNHPAGLSVHIYSDYS